MDDDEILLEKLAESRSKKMTASQILLGEDYDVDEDDQMLELALKARDINARASRRRSMPSSDKELMSYGLRGKYFPKWG